MRCLFFLLLVLPTLLHAQKKERIYNPNDEYVYRKEMSGGIRIQTNGFSIFTEFGWIKNIYKTRFIQLEYQYFMDYKLKKEKAIPVGKESGRDYFYGMQNQLHTIRFGYGLRRTFADKARRNGVRFSYMILGGISLGLLKPYYLDLKYPTDTIAGGFVDVRSERYSEANKSKFINKEYISEASSISKGMNQMQPVPGLHVKTGINFDWGTRDEYVKALEAGVMADFYYKQLPTLINRQNRFYRFSAYLSFQFGKRW
jgi:hypothetical protein